MVDIFYGKRFTATFSRIKDQVTKSRIYKQMEKIRKNPRVGKPMSNQRKGSRELRIKPFRLSYAYLPSLDRVVVLDIYHKKKQ